jgi:hypothetical protein
LLSPTGFCSLKQYSSELVAVDAGKIRRPAEKAAPPDYLSGESASSKRRKKQECKFNKTNGDLVIPP